MGWLDGRPSGSKVFVRSPARSSSGHHSSYRPKALSVFSSGGRTNRSSSSFVSSSSRVRPRPGFIRRIIQHIRRWLHDLYYYASRHPIKVFLMVVVPLLVSGVLQKLLSAVGVRLPKGLMGGMSSFGGILGNSQEHGDSGSGGLSGSVHSLMNIAKMFL